MSAAERAVRFRRGDDWLYGVLNRPTEGARRGVLILVGGPQYRAGSHRQFVLLARQLAAAGIPVMRFDFAGMGDSEGTFYGFDRVDGDVRCALDYFFDSVPEMAEVVIWGLCDAAAAALLYAPGDGRVSGLVLLNPWVHTEQGQAKAYLRHYYLARLGTRAFWGKLARGRFDFRAAAAGFVRLWRSAASGVATPAAELALPERMLGAYARFSGRVLWILSGDDMTAREFSDLAGAQPRWRALMRDARTQRLDLAGADHTFSRRMWRDQVGRWTHDWVVGPAGGTHEEGSGGRRAGNS